MRDPAGALGENVPGMSPSSILLPQGPFAFGFGSLDDAAQASIVQIKQLEKDIGIPERLRDVGVSADMIPQLTEQAMEDGCHLTNPRKCQRKDMAYLYNKSL